MTRSSYRAPPKSGGVIPGGDASKVGWDLDLGQTSPSGSMFSSMSDMVKAGQGILQSKLLSSAQTRRWLKPLIQTGYVGSSVGAPWEIRDIQGSDGRMTQLFTKQGDVGNYYAAIVLSPEQDLGWVVLSATLRAQNGGEVRATLMNAFSQTFMPMAEKQAKTEATVNFAGTYVDTATNSSVQILATDNRPGLSVENLISRGAPFIAKDSPLIEMFGTGASARLYPSGLQSASPKAHSHGVYQSKIGFRAEFFNETQSGTVEDPCYLAWVGVGAPTYGLRSAGDFVFDTNEDGIATALEVRMLRLKLQRQA